MSDQLAPRVVIPPEPFRREPYLSRLNNLFTIHADFEMHQIAGSTGCTMLEAMRLFEFLIAKGYGKRTYRTYRRRDGPVDVFVPSRPITFVAEIVA